jgi:hypothetical protein
VRNANKAHFITEPVSRKERSKLDSFIAPLEEKFIYSFALKENQFLTENEFQKQYGARADAKGNEQLVYISNDARYVIKVNDRAYHGTWLETI